MAYKISKYLDLDLKLKADRAPSATKDPAVAYAQTALNDLNVTPRLKVDGQFGPKTQAGVLKFQEAAGVARTGLLDQATWNVLDWRVYGAQIGRAHV
jgi:peptidoglycan hydrolase-like protein with peptidoglycan-binding domain